MSHSKLAMTVNIALLEDRLKAAHTVAVEAAIVIGQFEQNLAIGTLLPLREHLAEIQTIFDMVLLLHRRAPQQSRGQS